MAIEWETVKKEYPNVYNAIHKIGYDEGVQEGKASVRRLQEQLNAFPSAQNSDDPIPESEVERRALEMWRGDPELQAEFDGKFEVWLAYSRANSEGRVQILGGVKS